MPPPGEAEADEEEEEEEEPAAAAQPARQKFTTPQWRLGWLPLQAELQGRLAEILDKGFFFLACVECAVCFCRRIRT